MKGSPSLDSDLCKSALLAVPPFVSNDDEDHEDGATSERERHGVATCSLRFTSAAAAVAGFRCPVVSQNDCSADGGPLRV